MATIKVESIVRLPRVQKIAILAGVVVVLIGLYWFLFYKNHSEELASRQTILTKKQQELHEQKVILADLPKFRKETEEMKERRQVALKELPNKKDIDKLLKDISYHAIESGLEILLFKPEKEVRKNFYAEIPVQLKLSGTYHDFGLFFDKIANLSRIVNVADLEIEKIREKGKEVSVRNLLEASCKAKTYKFIEEKAGGEAKDNAKNKEKK